VWRYRCAVELDGSLPDGIIEEAHRYGASATSGVSRVAPVTKAG
jgi:hypothetical protein